MDCLSDRKALSGLLLQWESQLISAQSVRCSLFPYLLPLPWGLSSDTYVSCMQDDHEMLTASGDQSIILWNTMYATQLGAFVGHSGSVKSIAVCPSSEDVFASGSRDGSVCLWDSRAPSVLVEGSDVPVFRPVATFQVRRFSSHPSLFRVDMLSSARAYCAMALPCSQGAHPRQRGNKRRRSTLGGVRKDSVTSVLYLSDGHTLASAGMLFQVALRVRFRVVDMERFRYSPALTQNSDRSVVRLCGWQVLQIV
jgi:WD40 repeat protein